MPTADTRHPARRLEALDGLRGLAAFGVLVLHVWMFSYGDLHRPPKSALDLAIGELRLGVQLFFVLSGFLIFRPFVAAALERRPAPGLRRYALRRAARILPGYWAALAAGFLLLRHLDHPMQVTAGQLPVFLLFAQNQLDTTIKHVDPPMWTLAVEVSFYVLAPLAGLLALRLGPARRRQVALTVTLVLAGAACTALSVERAWPVTLSTSLLLHLGEFGAGMTVAALLHGRAVPRAHGRALVAAGAALVVANSAWHALAFGPQELRSVIGDLPGVAGMALVLAALVASPIQPRWLARGPVRWLGTVSYGVYLAHFLVIIGLRQTGHWPETLDRQLLLVAAITLAIATAVWLLIERPAIRWAQARTARDRRAPGAPERPRFGQPVRDPLTQRTGELRVLRPQPSER